MIRATTIKNKGDPVVKHNKFAALEGNDEALEIRSEGVPDEEIDMVVGHKSDDEGDGGKKKKVNRDGLYHLVIV